MGRRSQVVRQRSAKPLFAGSIPAVASSFSLPPNFVFTSTVESHGWYLLAPFRWSPQDRVLRRREALPGLGAGELTVTCRKGRIEAVWQPLASSRAPRQQDALESAATDGAAEIRRRLERMLQLSVDTAEFVEMSRGSIDHDWIAGAGFGRLLCGTTLWEDAVKIIATTNTTWRQTVKMVEHLVVNCGREGAFPAPKDILRFGVEELQQVCRLGYRAKTIHALASGIADDSIDLKSIADPRQTTEELFRSFRTLPGIGPYGAAHLLAMEGRHDYIAVDTEFRRFVRERYHRGRRVSDETMLRRYRRWGRWKYLAYWSELWKSVAGQLQPRSDEKEG
jgi:3-methyladenine DNA glycosylase/8-oxoguanine DNA glycosylase